MKNNVFDIGRFNLLLRRQFTENRKSLMWEAISIFGVFMLLFVFAGGNSSGYTTKEQWNLYAITLIFTGIYNTKLLTKLRPDGQGLHQITLPASQLEKLLSVLVYSAVVFPLLYSIVFFASNYLTYFIFHRFEWMHMELLTFDFTSNMMPFSTAIWGMIILNAIFILGALWFKKHYFLKTIASGIAIGVLVGLLLGATNHLPAISSTIADHSYIWWEAERNTLKWIDPALRALNYLIAPFLWMVAYFRLTEKQI